LQINPCPKFVGSRVAGTQGDDVVPQDGLVGPGWGSRIHLTEGSTIDATKESCQEGHIWLQTPTLMQGYLNQPELTAEVVSDGWFYTGDIGHIDDQGRLFISGRVHNEINFGGTKVIPEDVDLLLSDHDDISESCTFGLEDNVTGQIVATAVVFKENTAVPSVKQLKEWAQNYVSDYKVPKVWYQVKDIPKTSRGKINRLEVANYCKKISKMK